MIGGRWWWLEVIGGQGEVEGVVAGGSGLNARTIARRRVQGAYKEQKNQSNTRTIIRTCVRWVNLKKNTPEAQTTRSDASFGPVFVVAPHPNHPVLVERR